VTFVSMTIHSNSGGSRIDPRLHLRYFHTAECGKSLVNALAEIVTEWRLS